jgi:hypothetical protein
MYVFSKPCEGIDLWCKAFFNMNLLIRHALPPLPPSIRHPSVILSERSLICIMERACMLSSFMTVDSAISVALSDISSDISSDIIYEKPADYAKIELL